MLTVSTCPQCANRVRAAPAPETGLVRCERCGTTFDPRVGETATDPRDTGARAYVDGWAGLKAGSTVGPYVLEELLGTGGMARVWSARQPGLDRAVAVKVLGPAFARDSGIRRRFQREADALLRLDHPNILPIIDGGEDAAVGLPYLVTPLAGDNLRASMRDAAGRPLTIAPARLLGIARQVLLALRHAHAEGMVHRDIKPENILLDDDDRVRLADFGIARLESRGDATAYTQLTRTDQVIGTYAYMAPEQSEGGRPVDHRADLYGLGMVLYECLAGHRPLGVFEPPADRVPGLDPRQRRYWNELVLRLLERDPIKRPASAQKVLEALERTARLHAGAHRGDGIPVREAVRDDGPDPRARGGRGSAPAVHGHRLYRSRNDGLIAGVCAGLARWSGIDVLWWRLGALVSICVFFGITILVYIGLAILLPACPEAQYRPRPLNAPLPRRRSGILFGVCELLGQRTRVDPWIWRLIALVTVGFGSWLVYLVLAIALPGPGTVVPSRPAPAAAAALPTDRSAARFWGVLCVGLLAMLAGGMFLIAPVAVTPGPEAAFVPVRAAGGGVLLLAGGALVAGLLAFISLFLDRAWPRGLGTGGGLVVLAGLLVLLGLSTPGTQVLLAVAGGCLLAGLSVGLARRRQDVLYATVATAAAVALTAWTGG